MPRHLFTFTRGACLALAATVTLLSPPAFAEDDPVVFRFATVGDSREDLAASKFDASSVLPSNNAPLAQDVLWGQNTKAFTRILETAQAQNASLFFENGDMIMGYGRAALPPTAATTPSDYIRKTDLGLFYIEYAFWRGLVAPQFDQGMYVVPVPGNHETQCSGGSNGNPGGAALCVAKAKVAMPENEDAWRANMGDLIADLVVNQRFSTVTGVAASNASGVLASGADSPSIVGGVPVGSQQQLTYSFDIQAPNGGPLLHFAVINTDPSGRDGVAPTEWLAGDFAAASARGASKFFVFGHKAAFTYLYVPTASAADLSTNAPARDAFWQLISRYNATYFCGHEHTYNVATYADPTGTYANRPYQVLVGSGGSPFEMTALAAGEPVTDRYYAWALVEITRSGKSRLSTFGFDEHFGPTTRILNRVRIQ